MKILHALAFPAAFAAGWGVVVRWPESMKRNMVTEERLAVNEAVPEAPATELSGNRELSAAVALTGLQSVPDLKEVFEAQGSDRWLRLGLFLTKANSADIAALMARQAADEILTEMELEMVWQQWVEMDVEAAVAWNGGDSGVWVPWGRIDPKTALAKAGEHAVRLGQVIRSIGLKDPGWAERLLARYPQVDGATGWAGAVDRLSAADPAAATALAMAKGAGWQKQVAAWTVRDPAAALAWAREIPQRALQRQAMAEVIREWTRSDPAAALGEALKLPPGRTGKNLTATAITALARVDAAAAQAALEKIPSGGPRQAAIAALAEGLAVNDPMAALENLRSLSWQDYYAQARPRKVWESEKSGGSSTLWFNGEENRESADTAIRILTKSHPVETINLLATHHAGDESAAEAFGQSFNQWTRADPEAASTWLRDQPPGAVRDTGIDQMIYILNAAGPTNDFEAAIQWAASAGDKNRTQFLEQVFRQWRKADFDAAAAAGAKYGIPVDRRDAVGSDGSMDIFSK